MHEENGGTPKDEFHGGHHVPVLQERVEDGQLDDHCEEELDTVGRCSILFVLHSEDPDSAVNDSPDDAGSEKQGAFKHDIIVSNRGVFVVFAVNRQ